MTLKTKLITTISMFFLVVALLITGVWAVSSANVNIGGTISFNATNIYATITGSITGATTTPTLSPLNYSANSTPTTTELNTWCQDLTFADATTPTIKWTVTIQNKSERALYVTLVYDGATVDGRMETSLIFDGGSAEGEQTIPAKTTKVYTMEISYSTTDISTVIDYDFDFVLKDSNLQGNNVVLDVTLVDHSSFVGTLFGGEFDCLYYWINASNDGGNVTETHMEFKDIYDIQFGMAYELGLAGFGAYLKISSSTGEFSEIIDVDTAENLESSVFTITQDTIIYLEFYQGDLK